MITKTITYTDYNGTQRTQDFNFNLNHIEFLRIQEGMPGGFQKAMEKAMLDKNSLALLDATEKLIRTAYGVKSEDGVRFMKSEEILREFVESEAYPVLLLELTEKGTGSEFIKGLFSKSMSAHVEVLNEAEELMALSESERTKRIGLMDPEKRKTILSMIKALKSEQGLLKLVEPEAEVIDAPPADVV